MKTKVAFEKIVLMVVYLVLFVSVFLAGMPRLLANLQPKSAVAAGPLALDDAVAILMPEPESLATTHTVTGLFKEPTENSEVAQWLMPGVSINLLGRSADGSFFAVARREMSNEVAGWVAAKDVDTEDTSTHATTMVKVYPQPGDNAKFANMLTYGQSIKILGTSRDGVWTAVANKDDDQGMLGWVITAQLQTESR